MNFLFKKLAPHTNDLRETSFGRTRRNYFVSKQQKKRIQLHDYAYFSPSIMAKIKPNNTTVKKEVVTESRKQQEQVSPILPMADDTTGNSIFSMVTKGMIPYLLILILAILVYANTFKHQFALDDDIVICKNEHVMQGIGGLKGIFTQDLFDSYYKQMNTRAQLSGGRYRPLSVATFALEQEIIGTIPMPDSIATIGDSTAQRQAYNQFLSNYFMNGWDKNKNGKGDPGEDANGDGLFNDKDTKTPGLGLRHVNNAILFGLACCTIFLFLSQIIFKQNKWVALLITLLFAAHPIHTEVVANIKSRDEILSIGFMMLTLYTAHRFAQERTWKFLLFSALSMLCALLSKEYGGTLVFLIPISLYLFEDGLQLSKNLKLYLSYAVIGIVYVLMRRGAGLVGESDLQDTELLNNPYQLATEAQRYATMFFIFLKYLWLQIYPATLVSDYGYNSIPYKSFSDPGTLLGMVLFFGMIGLTFFLLKKRNWMAFPLAFYLLNILLVTNFVFNIGATMGERLVFHSSLGFCIFLGYGIYYLSKKMNMAVLSAVLLLPILVLYSMKTFSRNKAWKNDISLAITDVELQPNSIALNGNAASRNIDLSELPQNKDRMKEFLNKSIRYGRKAISMHDQFVNGYLNLGLAYAKMDQYDSAKVCWDKAFSIYPSHPQKLLFYNLLSDTYYQKGFNLGGKQQWHEGKLLLQKAVEINPYNSRYWYDLGGFAYNDHDYELSKMAWRKAYEINPNDPEIIKVQALFPQ